MTANLRVATPDDAERVCVLGARLFEQTFGPDNTASDMADYLAHAFVPAKWRIEIEDPNRLIWIAEEDGVDFGYVSLVRDTRVEGVTGARTTEVERIYVDRSLHGGGLGRRLMQTCVEQAVAWNSDELWLAVWQRNARAIAFYEKNGFRIVGQTTFQLGSDLQHDFVMARFLTCRTS